MESVYLETTVISYLVARPSRDLVLAAHQGVTRDWWDNERGKYRCVVSDEVVAEARRGDPTMAARRLASIGELEVIPVTSEARELAVELVGKGSFPPSMYSDAIHLSVAICCELDYLLTWNCRHLANLAMLERLQRMSRTAGWRLPKIGTPLELGGGATDVHE